MKWKKKETEYGVLYESVTKAGEYAIYQEDPPDKGWRIDYNPRFRLGHFDDDEFSTITGQAWMIPPSEELAWENRKNPFAQILLYEENWNDEDGTLLSYFYPFRSRNDMERYYREIERCAFELKNPKGVGEYSYWDDYTKKEVSYHGGVFRKNNPYAGFGSVAMAKKFCELIDPYHASITFKGEQLTTSLINNQGIFIDDIFLEGIDVDEEDGDDNDWMMV